MAIHQYPVVGAWYVNLTGQLIKARFVSYTGNQISSVVVEYLDGHHKLVAIKEWLLLDLEQNIAKAGGLVELNDKQKHSSE